MALPKAVLLAFPTVVQTAECSVEQTVEKSAFLMVDSSAASMDGWMVDRRGAYSAVLWAVLSELLSEFQKADLLVGSKAAK